MSFLVMVDRKKLSIFRDNPDQVKKYLEGISPLIKGFTGSPEQVCMRPKYCNTVLVIKLCSSLIVVVLTFPYTYCGGLEWGKPNAIFEVMCE